MNHVALLRLAYAHGYSGGMLVNDEGHNVMFTLAPDGSIELGELVIPSNSPINKIDELDGAARCHKAKADKIQGKVVQKLPKLPKASKRAKIGGIPGYWNSYRLFKSEYGIDGSLMRKVAKTAKANRCDFHDALDLLTKSGNR